MNATRIRGRLCVLAIGVLAVQACADNANSAGPLVSVLETGAALQPTAVVRSTVSPSVVLLDNRSRPVSGAQVTFEVTAGGGTIATPVVVTDGSGRAAASWLLSATAGTNRAVARATGEAAVTFTVTGEADAAAEMKAHASVPEIAAASSPVPTAPSVRVTDQYGNAVAGVQVDFAVVQGGGSVAGGAQQTGADGVATAGSWTTGAAQVENVLTASAAGLAPVRFSTRAVAISEDGLAISKLAGDETTCPVNTTGCRFAVRVMKASGGAAAGEAVLWRGPGGVTATSVTNANGLATSPNIGSNSATGSYTQSAQLLGSGTEVVFNYRLVPNGTFNIDLRFVSDASPAVRTAFEQARVRWQQVITGKLPDFSLTGSNQVQANACGIDHPAINEVVDDLLILVEIVPIDGPGKILGSAGPCMIRGSSNLPILGVIKLDSDDLELMESNGTLRDVILHEIGHVLGLGTLWSRFSLVQGAGSSDPYYTGVRAQPGFVLGGGSILNGIPLENSGGAGTRDSHWRESTLANELMTGFINRGGNPLSSITVGSLMDMGYQVNFGAADGYALPGMFGTHARDAAAIELHEVPLPAPRRVW
jgi:hypothetical protein